MAIAMGGPTVATVVTIFFAARPLRRAVQSPADDGTGRCGDSRGWSLKDFQ